ENAELAVILKLIADQFQSEMKKSGGVVGDFSRVIADWRVQVGAVSGVLVGLAKSTANYGDEAVKSAQKVGMTIEAWQGMAFAANLADVSNEQLRSGLE